MKRTLEIAVVLALAALTCATSAHAQPGGAATVSRQGAEPPPPPPPAVITPPVVEKDEGAAYPRHAIDDKVTDSVTVTVELEVDATGAVKNATVPAPQGHGFDEAATEAAKKLVFKPATRNGKPIAARVTHKYVFAPPPSRILGRVRSLPSDKPLAGATVTALRAGFPPQQTTTKDDGTFTIDGLAPGAWTLTVASAGHLQETSQETIDP
ncbi:MAG TPA: TonB family protein, partial [Labilithrix sp.]